MTGSRLGPAILAGLFLGLTLASTLQGVQGDDGLDHVPSEAQCRPYIEKALKDLGPGSQEQEQLSDENDDATSDNDGTNEAVDADDHDEESRTREKREASDENEADGKAKDEVNGSDQMETVEITSVEAENEQDSEENKKTESGKSESSKTTDDEDGDTENDNSDDQVTEDGSKEDGAAEEEEILTESDEQKESQEDKDDNDEDNDTDGSRDENESVKKGKNEESKSAEDNDVTTEEEETVEEKDENVEEKDETVEEKDETIEEKDETIEEKDETVEEKDEIVQENAAEEHNESGAASIEDGGKTEETSAEASKESADKSEYENSISKSQANSKVDEAASEDQKDSNERVGDNKDGESGKSKDGSDEEQSTPEEELTNEIEIPEILRPREHVNQLLKLDEENEEAEKAIERIGDIILRDLKRVYDNAIQPLETLYKYRDLSNRHFGDPEIFSKPLILFMGPWSGGKSTIINYLLDIEFKQTSLRTGLADAGAEPSPAYFNILMHGEEEEILDGTQLAADWTFSGLQKFGQGLLDRLKGYRLKSKLLEKVNIVEIPGILEIRKQVQRLFPFNDACQWFIDRADIIFLVYDPAKLDVGPETEAILDQLKGREYQTRIILNKADQVKPEELMRVQGALIWNISPLMSSAEPPVMYSTSLWSMPYEAGAPTRLLYAQERAFLRDLRTAIDKRVEHKIASARRFAVRVRNHAKMVDCYLTTYYNHKSFFGNKKDVSDKIIENPQDYHIYEGLSTLTNISRYDLPDPDVYRDFFRLNPLYNFPLLSTTCTYFRGCPINRLDVAIAYDLPELVGKYKRSAALHLEVEQEPVRPSTANGAPRTTMS